MYSHHIVRFGLLGELGRFAAVDSVQYRRGARVVCRTYRGLEVAEVLSEAPSDHEQVDGQILRGVSVQDDLLLARLDRNRLAALGECEALLRRSGVEEILVDVEHLFDGQTLVFYFLGEVSPEVQRVIEPLAEAYEASAQFRKFTETLVEGCGPGCGTESAEGGGCGAGECASCVVAQSCHRQSP